MYDVVCPRISLHFNLHECMLRYVHKKHFLVKRILAVKGIPLSHML